MKKGHFSERAAGAKTIWIIDFGKEKGEHTFYIPSPPGTPGRDENLWIDTKDTQKITESYGEFLAAITKLCALLEKENKEMIKEQKASLFSLGEVIKKFNEMLKRFRKKKDESPPP